MTSYRIVQHKVPCQHIREYPRAAADSQDEVFHLAVKQYIPIDNPQPQPGDVTIIGAQANGFPKELYEPVWDDLISKSKEHGFRIRSIWMADVSHQGESGVLNEDILGNDPSWYDHSRDLLHLINLKRDEMPRPIIGVGHSMGGAQLANLAYFHPRLFTTLILIDPVIQPRSAELGKTNTPGIARLSSFRRDIWPSREEAARSFLKSPFYQSWDQRVFDRWVEFGLRDLPTPTHPQSQSSPPQVTLATPISQEVHQFLRPNYEGYANNGKPVNRETHADLDPDLPETTPFYRPEAPSVYKRLPALRPSTFYIFGSTSTTSGPEFNEAKLKATGTGIGGSGGVSAGRVKGVTFEGVGHLIAMEAVEKTAQTSAEWIGAEMDLFRRKEKEWETQWRQGKTLREKQDLDDTWRRMMGGPPKRRNGKGSKM